MHLPEQTSQSQTHNASELMGNPETRPCAEMRMHRHARCHASRLAATCKHDTLASQAASCTGGSHSHRHRTGDSDAAHALTRAYCSNPACKLSSTTSRLASPLSLDSLAPFPPPGPSPLSSPRRATRRVHLGYIYARAPDAASLLPHAATTSQPALAVEQLADGRLGPAGRAALDCSS
jgi:hypothetical protein